MIVVNLLSIHIKMIKVDHGVFDKEEFKIYYKSQNWYQSLMATSCLTFDLQCNLNIQYLQSLITGHANVQISVGRSYAFFNDRDLIRFSSHYDKT